MAMTMTIMKLKTLFYYYYLLLSLSAVMVVALDVQGIGTLTCPADAAGLESCEPGYIDANPFACGIVGIATCMWNEQRDTNGLTIELPCECLVATDCPDTCVFTPEGEEVQGDGKNFEGPGTVTCPIDVRDSLEDSCIPNPLSCGFVELFSCSLGLVSNLLEGVPDDATEFSFELPCECVEATNCPESCTFSEGITEPENRTGVDFYGPGTVVCTGYDNIVDSGCFPSINCLELTCLSDFDLETVTDDGDFSAFLPCDCIGLTGCSETCEFTPAPNKADSGISYTGPGTLSCPVESYVTNLCFPEDVNGTCDMDPDCDFNVLTFQPFADESLENIEIALPCSCLEISGCSDNCTFTEEVKSRQGNKTFTGPGTITCSVEDYVFSPCIPNELSTDCAQECFDGLGLFDFTLAVIVDQGTTFETFDIALPCDCLELVNCPNSCEYKDTGDTPSPTSPPTDAPTIPPTPTPAPVTGPPVTLAPVTQAPVTAPPTSGFETIDTTVQGITAFFGNVGELSLDEQRNMAETINEWFENFFPKTTRRRLNRRSLQMIQDVQSLIDVMGQEVDDSGNTITYSQTLNYTSFPGNNLSPFDLVLVPYLNNNANKELTAALKNAIPAFANVSDTIPVPVVDESKAVLPTDAPTPTPAPVITPTNAPIPTPAPVDPTTPAPVIVDNSNGDSWAPARDVGWSMVSLLVVAWSMAFLTY